MRESEEGGSSEEKILCIYHVRYDVICDGFLTVS